MTEIENQPESVFDFGWGEVPAHRHNNPDGTLAKQLIVSPDGSAYWTREGKNLKNCLGQKQQERR